jgi:hypothetical protein
MIRLSYTSLALASGLEPTQKEQNEENDKNQAYAAAGVISPTPAIGPSGYRTDKRDQQDDKQDSYQHVASWWF